MFLATGLVLGAAGLLSLHAGDAMALDCPPLTFPKFKVLKVIPQQKPSFTEGLVYLKGALYESTGNIEGTQKTGKSVIQRIFPKSGSVQTLVETPQNVFGEGLAFQNDIFYQLSYKEQKIFTYSFSSPEKLELSKQFDNPQKQGWGLTSNGEDLIASDGSETLFFLDPKTLKTKKTVRAQDSTGRTYPLLNELEYVNGRVFANVFKFDWIVGIHSQSGCVDQMIDMKPLRNLLTEDERQYVQSDIEFTLNGIAYDSKSNHFYITGKMWPKFFEVEFVS